MKDILFILGPARGGTTFLNNLMDQWFSVGTGPEGTFILATVKKAEQLGELSVEENRRALAEFITQQQMFNIIRHRWPQDESFDVSADDILTRMTEQTAAGAIYAAFQAVADYRGKHNVGNKNPGYTKELDVLHQLFPENAKYLFVVRDGRDVALSLREVTWGGNSSYEAAKNWQAMIDNVERFKQKIPKERMLTVKYEELLSQPEQTMTAIGHFVGSDQVEEIVNAYVEQTKNSKFKNNFDKWRTAMSQQEQYVFEAVAGDALAQYGYHRSFQQANLSIGQKCWYECKIFLRLVKLNIYHRLSVLPQDKKEWQSSKLKRMFQPGKLKSDD